MTDTKTAEKATDQKPETVFVAQMSTECFHFTAVGRTEEQAIQAIHRKFHELATQRMTIEELEGWYGLSVTELAFGEAERL